MSPQLPQPPQQRTSRASSLGPPSSSAPLLPRKAQRYSGAVRRLGLYGVLSHELTWLLDFGNSGNHIP